MRFREQQRHFAVLAVALTFLLSGIVSADVKKEPPRRSVAFGSLSPMSEETARQLTLDWLRQTGRIDEPTYLAFLAIWSHSDVPVLNRVTATFALADADAALLLSEARDPFQLAPLAVPPILRDTKRPVFLRANLALAYARALSKRRAYEESLEALKPFRPEDVVDPCAFLFHRAVAEHALMHKDEALRSINRMLDDGVDVPERYRMVAVLMAFDMQTWRDKDLGAIARKMNAIERRLDLARGGPQTQKIQKEVVARLDEIIKELENQTKSECNGGSCPDGGQPLGGTPNSPMRDSKIAPTSGPGNVDPKKLENIARAWGKLPEKERAQAMQELTRDMPPRYREVIEAYFRKLAQQPQEPGR